MNARSYDKRLQMAWIRAHPLLTTICMLVACIVSYAVWKFVTTAENTPARAGPGARGALVVTEPAQMIEIRDEIEAIGTVEANESIRVTAQVTDTVSAVSFEDGQFVEEGTVLVSLTNEEETALLAEARANHEDAVRQHARFKDLVRQGSASEQQTDEARTRQMAARGRLHAIEARLDDRLIKAPFAGLLGFRRISPGTLVTPGTEITSLDDISLVKLDFSVPERFFSSLTPGLDVIARSSAWGERKFVGKVAAVDARIDPNTRAVTVRARIPNADGALRPGMLLTIRLVQAREQVLVVSEAAIVQRQTRSYVYTIVDGKANRIEVTIGRRRPGIVEIVSGLSPQQEVVTLGADQLRPGMPARIQGAAGGMGSKPKSGKPGNRRPGGAQS
jgi:membrane fusion protein (multidrug efflux system)